MSKKPPTPKDSSEGMPDSAAEPGVFRFRRSHLYAAVIPLTFVTGLAAGYLLWGRDKPASPTTADEAPSRFDIPVDDDPYLGPEDAPITIVEFSDFNCPYCRKFHQEIFPQLMAAYPEKIRFVYRDLPVVGGGQVGYEAAQAANCAQEQGAYWAFHDALFSGRLPLTRDSYLQYAEELELDAQAIEECLDDSRYAEEVIADARFASGLGVSSTPTFFVNGLPVIGAQPLGSFTRVIDAELEQ